MAPAYSTMRHESAAYRGQAPPGSSRVLPSHPVPQDLGVPPLSPVTPPDSAPMIEFPLIISTVPVANSSVPLVPCAPSVINECTVGTTVNSCVAPDTFDGPPIINDPTLKETIPLVSSVVLSDVSEGPLVIDDTMLNQTVPLVNSGIPSDNSAVHDSMLKTTMPLVNSGVPLDASEGPPVKDDSTLKTTVPLVNSSVPSDDSALPAIIDDSTLKSTVPLPNSGVPPEVPPVVDVSPLSATTSPVESSVHTNLNVSSSVDGPPKNPFPLPASPPPTYSVAVLQRIEDITKSQSDKRQYRALLLSNHLKVMLVSDSTAETSAAALQVNVGHCSDPDELPGLAHFCEHMLIMGTEKYPEENEFDKFLSAHGGSCNACTGTDFTMHHFNVLPEHLGAALDIFAQFFIAPLFTESGTDRELNAVDSEHQNDVQSDGSRLVQQERCAASPGHPYRKFGTGNRHTLETVPKEKGIDVRQELLQFHQRWYSANIMALSVVGKESLDDLEALVVPLFSRVVDSAVEPPAWAEHPFPAALCRKRTYCVPVTDFRSLCIDFPLPEYSKEHYVGKPYSYLSHLIGHEGAGSLLSALKSRGWCNSLAAGTSFPARGFGFFGINVDLTEEGVQHVDDIVLLTFQYIAMLRAKGPQREVWEEQSELRKIAFRFEDPSEPMSLAKALVGVLQEFPSLPMDEVLHTWRAWEWRPDLIEQALALFTPGNVRLQIVAKCFSDKCTLEEPWYGTKYLEEDIHPDKIKEWESLALSPEFLMPPPNQFIPAKIELEETKDPTCETVGPEIVKDTAFMRLWFKQDNEFLLPKASVVFELNSPVPAHSPRNYQLTSLWTMLVKDSLQESLYAAGLAGLEWGLNCGLHQVNVTTGGFDHAQHLLLEMMMERLVTFQPDPPRFTAIQEQMVRGLKNRDKDQPCEQADYELDSYLSERVSWTTQQLLEATKSLTVEMLLDFVPRFLRSVYVEGLVFGNYTRERALKLAGIVESSIPKDAVPVMAQELLSCRALEIEEGAYYLRCIENAVHTSSCTLVYLQCGMSDSRSKVVLGLLAMVLDQPCYETLRTKEQLGYIVRNSMWRAHGAQGLAVLVQGERAPALLERRIDAFLYDAQEYLEKISDEEFYKSRTALAALCSERPKQISSKYWQMWGEIVTQMYNFDSARMVVDELNTVSREELIQFYKRHISPSSLNRRKLCVHVVSTAEGAGRGTELQNQKNATESQETVAQTQETEAQTQETKVETQETEAQSQESEAHNQETEAQNQEAEANAQETQSQTQETETENDKTEAQPLKTENDNDIQPTIITDLIEFKSRRRLYPRLVGSAVVPRRGS